MEEGSFLDIGRLGILHQGGSQDSQERPAEAGILLQKVVRFLVLNFLLFCNKKIICFSHLHIGLLHVVHLLHAVHLLHVGLQRGRLHLIDNRFSLKI